MKKILLSAMLAISCILMAGVVNAQKSNETNLIPTFNSDAEKTDWIRANRDKYVSAGGRLDEKLNPQGRSTNVVKEIVIVADDPTFPTYVVTGNPELDAANYDAKKIQWYAQKEAASNEVNPDELKSKIESLAKRGIIVEEDK